MLVISTALALSASALLPAACICRPPCPTTSVAGRRAGCCRALADAAAYTVDDLLEDDSTVFNCRVVGDDQEALEAELMTLAATTSRGADMSSIDTERIATLVAQLECFQPPDVSTGVLDGTWRLAYASCPAYRSSPFFAGFEQAFGPAAAPLVAITDGLPFYRVGDARQIIRNSGVAGEGTLVSEITVEIYAFNALLPPLRSVMTTTSSARPEGAGGDLSMLILDLQSTEVKESALPFSDAVAFPVQRVFDSLKSGSATVRQRTSYLSPTLRVARTAPSDDVLVYVPEAKRAA